jgi:hypothetical protein
LVKKFGKVQKKIWKKFRNFGKSSEISETGFSECLEISEIWKFGNSELSKNYKKMMLNSKFENREKLVPTQKPTQKFG